MSASAGPPPSDVAARPARKPRFALFVATACGLGYIPIAPGTFGALAGVLVALAPLWAFVVISGAYILTKHGDGSVFISARSSLFLESQIALAVLTAAAGVWSANTCARFWQVEDPQRVVIDEVSGQHLALLLGCGFPVWWRSVTFPWNEFPLGVISFHSVLSWKYLLVGLILFRLFDIWKPFPVRQAESLPGGWGIMADDWVAAVYAGIGLWIARAAGL